MSTTRCKPSIMDSACCRVGLVYVKPKRGSGAPYPPWAYRLPVLGLKLGAAACSSDVATTAVILHFFCAGKALSVEENGDVAVVGQNVPVALAHIKESCRS